MKNTIFTLFKISAQNVGLILVIGLCSISSFLSCTIVPITLDNRVTQNLYQERIDSSPPADAFSLVMTETKVSPDKCLPSPKFKECLTAIKKLPIIKNKGLGSGLLVRAKTETVFLTAAHVCVSSKKDIIFEMEGIKISTKSSTDIALRTHEGEIIRTEVVKLNVKKDLCALRPARIYTKPVELSDHPPSLGDTVWAISAPTGINFPGMSLIFSGHYSGHVGIFHHYTIPAKPGSSGSVVLDDNFRAVGMINAAYVNFESIGMGAGYLDLKEFLDSI